MSYLTEYIYIALGDFSFLLYRVLEVGRDPLSVFYCVTVTCLIDIHKNFCT